MNSVDLLVIMVVLPFALGQAIRGREGMGRPLFEMVGIIVAASTSVSWYEGLGKMAGIPEPLALALLFIVIGFLGLFFASLLFNLTGLSFEPFNIFFSFIFGVALGWAVANVLLRFLLLTYGKASSFAFAVEESGVAKEILEFKTFKALLGLLYRARLGPETTP